MTYTLNLWGPILRMTNAASQQGLVVFKERLREFLESSDAGRQAMAMSSSSGSKNRNADGVALERLDGEGRRRKKSAEEDEADDI